jgi:uncharacterized protein DUF4383
LRILAAFFAIALLGAAATNYIPGLTDAQGRAFGIFALDIYDDLLHLASATWAALAALMGRNSSRFFLRAFGLLYLADGLMGLVTGSGYLDLGIIINGVQTLPFMFKVMANTPHILLGSIGVIGGFFLGRGEGRAVAA